MSDDLERPEAAVTSLERQETAGTSYLEGGDGPPVVFLHGIPGSAHTWEAVAGELGDAYRVVVPDLRGFGRSAPPDGDYYMEGQARAILELLDAIDVGGCSLVCHDFGGPVGLTMMRLSPDLVVDRLVLSNTNVFTDTYVPIPLRVAAVPLLGGLFFRLVVGNRIGAWAYYRGAVVATETATWSTFRRHLTQSGMSMTSRIFHRSLADLEGNYREVERTLRAVEVPTLVLWSDDDPFFSLEVGERIQAAIAGAELAVYDDTGHYVPEERPAAVAADVRRFLDAGR